MLKDADTYLDYLCNWELVVWCIALGIYIMRFMTLGLKINKKYRNLSVLITEQVCMVAYICENETKPTQMPVLLFNPLAASGSFCRDDFCSNHSNEKLHQQLMGRDSKAHGSNQYLIHCRIKAPINQLLYPG